MNYKLALKLKNAGFPQSGTGYGLFPDGNVINSSFVTDVILYVPTLSELIEVCGEEYTKNGKKYDFTLVRSLGKWFASFTDEEFTHSKMGTGPTPEEAVANLWLELNKK